MFEYRSTSGEAVDFRAFMPFVVRAVWFFTALTKVDILYFLSTDSSQDLSDLGTMFMETVLCGIESKINRMYFLELYQLS
jgi:hypothetical protein